MFDYRPKESYWCFSLPNQTPEELKSSEFAVYLNNFCNKLFERRWPHLKQGKWRTEFSGCKWGEAGRANSSCVIFPALPSAQPCLFSSCHGTGRLYPISWDIWKSQRVKSRWKCGWTGMHRGILLLFRLFNSWTLTASLHLSQPSCSWRGTEFQDIGGM